MYADIIVDITHEKLDKVFQYRIPSELEGRLKTGMEVVVPFGRGNKEIRGYVTGFSQKPGYDEGKIKPVLRVARDSLAIESRLVALAAWMKEHYGGTMIQALKTVIPIKKQEKARQKKRVRLLLNEEEGRRQLDVYLHKNQKARARLLAALLDQPQQDYELLTKKLNVTSTVVRALEEQKIICLESEKIFRNPIRHKEQERKIPDFTAEQQHAIDVFREDYDRGLRKTYLVLPEAGRRKFTWR